MPKRRGEEERKDSMPLPNGKDMLLGVIQQFLGYDRARVLCEDGKVRLCRIPGRYKKRVWMRVGDVVLVAPWEFQRDEKGDIIYRYSGGEVQKLDSMRLTEGLKKVLEGTSM
ncbi:MAG: translation initiation factor eIF-1A [Thermofilaceae archaeon]